LWNKSHPNDHFPVLHFWVYEKSEKWKERGDTQPELSGLLGYEGQSDERVWVDRNESL
jgi:hypothetical protein